MSYYKPKRLRWGRVVAGFIRGIAGVLIRWPLLVCAALIVSTNSICQGQQVPTLWPLVFNSNRIINFAYTSFKWSNLASHNAGVTVAIVGLSAPNTAPRKLYVVEDDGVIAAHECKNINAYLVSGLNVEVEKATVPICDIATMVYGNVEKGGKPLTIFCIANLQFLTSRNCRLKRKLCRLWKSVSQKRGRL